MGGRNDFPKEYWVPIAGDEYRIGKIEIFCIDPGQDGHSIQLGDCNELGGDRYYSEINVVQKESSKIFFHVGRLYGFDSEEEALNESVQALSQFLNDPSKFRQD